MKDARAWWPISTLLVAVIYTGSKSLVRRVWSSLLSPMLIMHSHSNSYLSPYTREHYYIEVMRYRLTY
jgi:hypothetical protein